MNKIPHNGYKWCIMYVSGVKMLPPQIWDFRPIGVLYLMAVACIVHLPLFLPEISIQHNPDTLYEAMDERRII